MSMEIMDQVEFELIRQAEQANLTKKQEEKFQDWVVMTQVSHHMLLSIINGDMELAGMIKGEPLIRLTPQGIAKVELGDFDDED